MKRPPILSSANPDDPRPWADLVLVDGSPTVNIRAFNGVAAFGLARAQREGVNMAPQAVTALKAREQAIVGNRQHKLKADKATERHVLAVTLEGDLEFVPESEQKLVYYAHLAWYEPSTGEWTALQFIDPTPPVEILEPEEPV